ncbi:dephospho-CoA kinase [Salmonirosea aquatica]|uniref:Dephospho-CoA kinase n=1 Tax=Salmonirosea aquatica TaxID=2654236 RepID=A0A7C9F530_9BACT|nr:dephospho-CoA kinase [Cytophagaceae bacterium SJW1-29]
MARALPLQVGVTGGIGSGKSVVCRIFACLGIPIYAADQRANWLAEHNPIIRQEVIALLGPDSYTSEGTYNRTYVASRVFTEPVLLQQLNQIIHPRVFADSDQWLRLHAQQPYVVREAALMNKAGDKNTLDYVVVVDAPVELRIERTKLRDPHRSETEIRAIIARQITDEARLQLADFVIENGLEYALIPQVLNLHHYFSGKAEHQE